MLYVKLSQCLLFAYLYTNFSAGETLYIEGILDSNSGTTGYSDSGLLVSISGILLHTPDSASVPSWFVVRNTSGSESAPNPPPITYQVVVLDRLGCWDKNLYHVVCPLSGIYVVMFATRKLGSVGVKV